MAMYSIYGVGVPSGECMGGYFPGQWWGCGSCGFRVRTKAYSVLVTIFITQLGELEMNILNILKTSSANITHVIP